MFGILDRYIGRSILLTSLLVLLTLVALASIFAFIGELDEVGQGSYTVGAALQYILLTIPGQAYFLFAPAVLLGSLLGLGALASNSELTVMKAAGISGAKIIRAVLLSGVLLMLLVTLIGETVMPKSEQIAEELRLTALEERSSVKGSRGLWLKSANRFVNIGTVMPDFSLLDVSVHEFTNQRITMALRAARVVPIGKDWELQDVLITRFDEPRAFDGQIDRIFWSEFLRLNAGSNDRAAQVGRVESLVSSDVLKSITVSPESLSAADLYEQINYLNNNQLDSRRIELALWVKIASPLSTLVMLMLSLPFVFASQRSGGAGQKIFIGIVLGILYTLVTRLLTQLALANGFSPAFSALIPLVCFALIAIVGIRRTT